MCNYISIHSLHTEGDPVPHPSISDRCHFNPLPPHGGRQRTMEEVAVTSDFNPLPPHGGRPGISTLVKQALTISIHSLHTEGDRWTTWNIRRIIQISIHSLHTEGDREPYCFRFNCSYFNPLPPHGGRRAFTFNFSIVETFQSTPSTRRETLLTLSRDDAFLFQSTPSTRRETSILPGGWITRNHFNPLPPHGGRHFPKTHSP